MNKNKLLTASVLALLSCTVLSGQAQAAPCRTSDVQVTRIDQFNGTTADATASTVYSTAAGLPAITAAACVGSIGGNDQPLPSTNLGYAGDGLLNGGTWKNAEPLFPGGAFISDNSPRNDLDKDGQADDPGWIMLGKYEGGRFDPMAVGGVSGIVLDGFFSITETSSGVGSWALTLDPAVASRAAAVLGANYFDQFALVFKAGPNFAVYDFTAAQFGITNPNATDPAYNWYGTFDVSDTLRNGGGKAAGISHVSVWARDPAENINAVPEPGTLALLGLAGAALLRQRRKTAA